MQLISDMYLICDTHCVLSFFSGIHGRDRVHDEVPGDGQGGTQIRPGEVQMLLRGE